MDVDRGELGRFLRRRRARREPHAAGLDHTCERRRVSGLRREELALLANVSPSYYARLEQGRPHTASPQVLDAISSVLGLDEDERAYLHDLAGATRTGPRSRRLTPEHPPEEVLRLLDTLSTVPALLVGRCGDVLAWTALGHALLFGHLEREALTGARRPNVVHQLFLDEVAAALFVDRSAKAADLVAHLRHVSGRHADDPALAELVGELSIRSPEFARLWADYDVGPCTTATYRLRHPVVGELTVQQQTLAPTGAPDQSLLVITPEPGASTAALRRLADTLDSHD